MTSITMLDRRGPRPGGSACSLAAAGARATTTSRSSCSTPPPGRSPLELDRAKAPITVENFLKYVDDGFYDGLIFHRVIPGFMIQGGGMDEQMRGEDRGAAAADQERGGQRAEQRARDDRDGPHATTRLGDLAVLHQPRDNANLDPEPRVGGYAVFGKVIDGMDVVDAIAKVEHDRPSAGLTTTSRSSRSTSRVPSGRPSPDAVLSDAIGRAVRSLDPPAGTL